MEGNRLTPAGGEVMAIVDIAYEKWQKDFEAECPDIFKEGSLTGPGTALRRDLMRTAYMAGKKASRQPVDLSPIATRKLAELAAQGYVTNGVAIFNPATGKRGLVDNLGYVGWQGAQGVDLGQFRESIQLWRERVYHDLANIRRDLPMRDAEQIRSCLSSELRDCKCLLALLDGRDAGTGVGS